MVSDTVPPGPDEQYFQPTSPEQKRTRDDRPKTIAPHDLSVSGTLARSEHLVDDAVLEGLGRREDVVAVDVAVDLLNGLAGVLSHGLLEPGTHAKNLRSLNLDVGCLTLASLAHRRLVDQ